MDTRNISDNTVSEIICAHMPPGTIIRMSLTSKRCRDITKIGWIIREVSIRQKLPECKTLYDLIYFYNMYYAHDYYYLFYSEIDIRVIRVLRDGVVDDFEGHFNGYNCFTVGEFAVSRLTSLYVEPDHSINLSSKILSVVLHYELYDLALKILIYYFRYEPEKLKRIRTRYIIDNLLYQESGEENRKALKLAYIIATFHPNYQNVTIDGNIMNEWIEENKRDGYNYGRRRGCRQSRSTTSICAKSILDGKFCAAKKHLKKLEDDEDDESSDYGGPSPDHWCNLEGKDEEGDEWHAEGGEERQNPVKSVDKLMMICCSLVHTGGLGHVKWLLNHAPSFTPDYSMLILQLINKAWDRRDDSANPRSRCLLEWLMDRVPIETCTKFLCKNIRDVFVARTLLRCIKEDGDDPIMLLSHL